MKHLSNLVVLPLAMVALGCSSAATGASTPAPSGGDAAAPAPTTPCDACDAAAPPADAGSAGDASDAGAPDASDAATTLPGLIQVYADPALAGAYSSSANASFYSFPFEDPPAASPPLDGCASPQDSFPSCSPACDQGSYCAPDNTCKKGPTTLDFGRVHLDRNGSALVDLTYQPSQCSQVAGCYSYDGSPDPQLFQTAWFTAGDVVTAAVSGAGPLPPLVVHANAPSLMDLTAPPQNPSAPFMGKIGQPLALRWTPGADPNGVVSVSLGGVDWYMSCAARDDGSWDMPWANIQDLLQHGPAGDELFVFVKRVTSGTAVQGDAVVRLELVSQASQWVAFVQ